MGCRTARASSMTGPNVVQTIIDASGDNWKGFPFLFALCAGACLSLVRTLTASARGGHACTGAAYRDPRPRCAHARLARLSSMCTSTAAGAGTTTRRAGGLGRYADMRCPCSAYRLGRDRGPRPPQGVVVHEIDGCISSRNVEKQRLYVSSRI